MKKATALIAFCLSFAFGIAQRVSINFDQTCARCKYAANQLGVSMLKNNYILNNEQFDHQVKLILDTTGTHEEFQIITDKKNIIIRGDGSGLIYGANALADELENGVPLRLVRNQKEKPRLPFRGIKYDLPWDTYRHSYALDQHQETCSRVEYWRSFLDMMAKNRLNVLTLWNLHPYTYMIKPHNFPEASPWNDEEMAEWKTLFTSIFKMAKERGIETYVIPFNIFVTPEFAKAHNVAMDNLDHHFFVRGDTSEIIKRYTRECVTQLLQEYPELTGMGLTLGEGMGGMTPAQRERWMKETIIEGMRLSGRKCKLIHRIPFSSTTGSLGPTSIETEKLTRAGIEQEAAMPFIEGPVWADLKFNWSHAHSSTKLIKVHGGKLYGAYFDPVPTDYKVVWTARNEDFFCLRWGVTDFVRQHIESNAKPYVGGYLIGSETYIPAKDYFTKSGTPVNWKYAFERQWLFYKIWGRLLYNPSTPYAVFQREFSKRYGKEASTLFDAYALAGKTPLRLASAFDLGWDFTLYSEGFMALNPQKKRFEYIDIDRQIKQPPLDPDYISIEEYVKAISSRETFASNKITPLLLADMLENDCKKALNITGKINNKGDASLIQEVADAEVWAHLGLYYAEKIRGGIALQTYRIQGEEVNKKEAVKHLELALQQWNEVIRITEPLYNEMPLVHFSEQDGKPWQENDNIRFHWKLLKKDVENDIKIAENSTRGD